MAALVAAWRHWRHGGSLAALVAAWRQWRHGGSLAAVAGGRKYAGGKAAAVGGCWRQSGGIVAAGGGMVTESLRAAGLQPASSLPALQIRGEVDQDRAGCPCMQMDNA